MKKCLVIIPHYNKIALLRECILHLLNQNKELFDIMIVDNGSDDGSAKYIFDLQKNNKIFHSILLNENMGFSFAVNKGIEYSIDKNYEFSLLLNNDAYVEKDFVINLVNKIESNKRLFAVSSLMINYHNNNLIDSFGDNYSIVGYSFQNKIGEELTNIINDEYCFSACAGASIYRNLVFEKIGLFDENFFAYLEDIDVSYRAKLYGYHIMTCKEAKCYHLGSATSGSKYNKFKVRISSRNNIYLVYKNMPTIQIVLNILPIFFGTLTKQIFFAKIGFGLDYFFGIFDAIKNLKNIKRIEFNKICITNYIIIEIELIINLLKYIKNLTIRHINK